MSSTLEHHAVEIRLLSDADLPAVVAIDRRLSGQDRRAFFARHAQSRGQSERISLSFVAAVDDVVVGFIVGGVYRGEFGAVEPLAILESMGVKSGMQRGGVAHALFAAFAEHAGRLDVAHIRTLVAWNGFDLLGFFAHMGMRPTGLVPLSVPVNKVRRLPEPDDMDELDD